jgi:HemX protein
MNILLAIVYTLGFVSYAAAAAASLWYLRDARAPLLAVAHRVSIGGACCLLVTFVLRWASFGLVPLTTTTDVLNLFVLLSSLTVLIVTRPVDTRALLSFYAPALAAIYLVNLMWGGFGFLREAPSDKLNTAFLAVHVGLAFLAYALFFVASLTSAAYVFQVRHLKAGRTRGLSQKLPSLEALDASLYRLMTYGFPFFAITLVLGMVWAWWQRDLLGANWFLSPKIVLSGVMVAFYAFTFFGRNLGWLRGKKLAFVVFYGFSSLLVIYIAMSVMRLRDYNFWGSA